MFLVVVLLLPTTSFACCMSVSASVLLVCSPCVCATQHKVTVEWINVCINVCLSATYAYVGVYFTCTVYSVHDTVDIQHVLRPPHLYYYLLHGQHVTYLNIHPTAVSLQLCFCLQLPESQK